MRWSEVVEGVGHQDLSAVITRAGLLTALAIVVLLALCWVLVGD
jgi:hypothetical protein